MHGLHLVHDVHDMQLLDRNREKIGRVDALVITLEAGGPPRVATILVGGPVRAERAGRWMVLLSTLMRRIGRVRRDGVSRVPFTAVRSIGRAIELDVDERDLESEHVEQWLKKHVICRIPGAGGETKK